MEEIVLNEVAIYKWQKPCWHQACRTITTMVSYNLNIGYNLHIGDVPKLDQVLMTKYPYVKKIYSKMAEQECIANTCEHCGRTQGNFFIKDDFIELESSGINMETLIDTVLNISLTKEDLGMTPEMERDMEQDN
jgi:hypothetical protein